MFCTISQPTLSCHSKTFLGSNGPGLFIPKDAPYGALFARALCIA